LQPDHRQRADRLYRDPDEGLFGPSSIVPV
jgi:hypothetical protein